MKLLLSWLEEFIDTGNRPVEDIARDLESLGHEVESITHLPLDNVVIGEITALRKHPNADRLHIAEVNIGNRTIQLIFGQYFPVKVGDRLPVAVATCQLPTGLVVESRTIRGVQSDGMLVADGELGRPLTTEGILRFEATNKPGTPVADVIGWRETIFDLSLTPNRGDVLSLCGVARELAAKWQQSRRTRDLPVFHVSDNHPSLLATIQDRDLCPRYSARLIANIAIHHAPTVMAGRLTMLGHGQYNSVVDVTNYVMEEFGVPLHAFDAEKLTLPLVIRRAKTGETIQLLDSQSYDLEDSMLVIADQTGPVALAGIMGGLKTAITNQTKTIILEAAYFEPTSIRRTRTKLKIVSDAAYRFERGTDPAALEIASNRAADLISRGLSAQVGQLHMTGGALDSPTIPFDPTRIDAYLGTHFGRKKIAQLLKRFEFQLTDQTISVPSWRHDVAIWQDLAEEVARLEGYDQLPQKALAVWQMPPTPDDSHYLAVEALKDRLVWAGWTEHIGSSFLSKKEIELFGMNEAVDLIKLANPVSEEAAYLRSTQLISLLKAIAKNPIFTDLKFFEIGTVWKPSANKFTGEQTAVSLIWCDTQPQTLPFLDQQLGTRLEKKILDKFKIRRPVMFSEVPVSFYLTRTDNHPPPVMRPPTQPIFRPPSRFQPVLRDLAILVDESVTPIDVMKTLQEIPQLIDVELFDQFSGGQLPPGKQSLAFHLLLENSDHSLTSQEIEATIKQVKDQLETTYRAKIR